jgi:polyphenol oxidase
MILHQDNGLQFYSFNIFEGTRAVSAVFTRKGGVSPEPWKSLNVGGSVGDHPENVAENRNRMFAALNKLPESNFDVWQIHSNTIMVATQPKLPQELPQKADAILTQKENITLAMRFADCVPVLLYDPKINIIALIHSGWIGTVDKIVTDVIKMMKDVYNSNPENILAGIGPSIGPDHYLIGEDVAEKVRKSFPDSASQLLQPDQDGYYFNLWAANKITLEQAGVNKIEIAGICTTCHPEDWFSHRGEKGKTGRFGVLFTLNQ